MAKITIEKDKCKGCEFCIIYCKKGAIKLDKKLNKRGVHPAVFIDPDRCTGCVICGLICPECCIEVFK